MESAEARARALGNDEFAPDIVEQLSGKAPSLVGRLPQMPFPVSPGTPLWGHMPRTGVVRIPVVIIDFWDYPSDVTTDQVHQMMGGNGFPGNAPTESLRNYYQRASYGALDLQPEVLGVYHYPGPRSQIDTSSYDSERQLVQQAFAYFDQQGTDFSRYDANNDGVVDYEVVYWAGPSGDWASFWWGHWGVAGDSTRFDGKTLDSWSWQWTPSGSHSADVVIHETGHALGLPDLYDYDDAVGPKGGVASWDPMSANTGDHNAFSKWMLGWLTPTVVSSGSQQLTLRPAGAYPDAAIVMPRYSVDNPLREFYLVEARNNTGNDMPTWLYPAATALQVWHFDATPYHHVYPEWGFRFDNSYTSHKFGRVMEADGLEHISRGAGSGISDLFVPGQSFGPATVPSSTPYYGTSSGVSITSLARVGSNMNLTASILPDDYDWVAPTSSSSVPTGWVNTAVPVQVTAVDASPYSSYLRVPSWGDTCFSGGIWEVANEGTTTVEFWSVDYAGNSEPTQTAYVRIDTTDPGVYITADSENVGAARISIEGADYVSGLKFLGYRLDGGSWVESASLVCDVPGAHTITAAAEDRAGSRVETQRSFSVKAKPYVRIPMAPSTMSRSKYYSVYGYLKPRHKAGDYPVRIYKWRYVSGSWKSYGYVTAKSSDYSTYSKYERWLRLEYPGKWRLRAYAPADSEHVAAWSSGYHYVTVK